MNKWFSAVFAFWVMQTALFAQLTPVVDTIPMRDGKWLMADVYVPSGMTDGPVILIQTPYGRTNFRWSLPLGIHQNINSSNYIFVIVDWRGTGGSLPAYVANPNRGQDGYDCIEWITQQSWSNGLVGTWGPSALGKIQFQTAKEQHPAHICMIPQVAGPQFEYLEYFPGGVYRTEYVQQLDALGFGLSTGLLANPVHNVYWTYAENQNFYPGSINIPTFMQGGWYDHNITLMLEFFNAIRTSSPLLVRDQHRLLMGPWVHGGHGAAYVGSSTQGQLSYPNAAGWSDSLGLLFFDYYLRGISNGWDQTDFITYYQMGENTWHTSSVWPPADVNNMKLYLQNDFTLKSGLPQNTTGSASYTLNPSDPSPTVGGPVLRADLDQGPYDQSPLVESRGDILIFDSPILGQDVVLKGNIRVHLFVSTDRTDTDFSVRLTDVYPDGRSMLLQDGIRRVRFRNGYNTTDTIAALPGQVYELDIDMMNTCNTFLAGHKIRLDITSSNYPRFDVNLNNGGPMYTAGDTMIATNTVFFNSGQASYIELMLQDFTGATETLHQLEMKIYPNPASDRIQIESPEYVSYFLINATGKIVSSGNFSRGINSLNLSTLAKGIYLLQCNGESGKVTEKIILQ